MKQALILVSGLPGVGKTTLGQKVAKDLNLMLISKDEIKVLLFNVFGIKDLDWNKKAGSASYDIMYYFVDEVLKNGKSLVIESNFTSDFADKKAKELKENYGCEIVQIYCFAKPEVVIDRFQKRIKARHPGHIDTPESVKENIAQSEQFRLNIDKTIEVDLSDFSKVDYSKIADEIKKLT